MSLGTASAQPATGTPAAPVRAELPREFVLLSTDEVRAYCANVLGNLGKTLAQRGERQDLSFEFFTAQTLLIYEFAAKRMSDEFVKAAAQRYYNNKPIREAIPYCRQEGQAAHERATDVNRKRAYDRADVELKKLWQQQ